MHQVSRSLQQGLSVLDWGVEKGKSIEGPGGVATEGCGKAGDSGLSEEPDGEIAYRRQEARRRTFPRAAGVFAEDHIPNIVETVLDAPVLAGEPQQAPRRRALGR